MAAVIKVFDVGMNPIDVRLARSGPQAQSRQSENNR